MDTRKLLELIDDALAATDVYVMLYYKDEKPMLNTKKSLHLLRHEVEMHPLNINERVLRAMHDTHLAALKAYDPSDLADAIRKVASALQTDIPGYKNLEPLRMDFGKGNPI